VAYNFQTGNNKMKLLMEYESLTQKVLILTRAPFVASKQFYFVATV
jgi:hypothetical protein